MKRTLSLLLMTLLLVATGCRKPDPDLPGHDPSDDPVEVVGEDYLALCTDLLGLPYSEAHALLVADTFWCSGDNETSATDHYYLYERSFGGVDHVCGIVTRDGTVVCVTAGEQWEYLLGECTDKRDRYVSLLRKADQQWQPWTSEEGSVNGTAYHSLESYIEALKAVPITRNCTDGEKIETQVELTGEEYVVKGESKMENSQFLQWYTGPNYTISVMYRSYSESL